MSSKNAVEKQFAGQHEGEEVELVFHQHPLVMRKALIMGLLVIMLAVVPLDFEQIYTILWLPAVLMKLMWALVVIVFAAWFYRWVGWSCTLSNVTERRSWETKHKGLCDREVNEWRMEKVSNVKEKGTGFTGV